MDRDNYISSRLDDQISWYEKRSKNAQCMYKFLRGFELLSATTIPIVAGFGGEVLPTEFVVGVLGALIAISSAIESLNNYHERWTQYRTTCESLKHEKYLFLSGASPYEDETSYQLLVQRVEALISKENSKWWKYTSADTKRSCSSVDS